MTAAQEILEEAKTILMEDGWGQKAFYKNGHYCLAGALNEAWRRLQTISVGLEEAYTTVDTMIDTHYAARKHIHHSNAMAFNDAKETTFNDIMTVLDKSIQYAKEHENDHDRRTE